MKISFKNQNIIIKAITVTGLIPSFYLLGLSFLFLPSFFSNLIEQLSIEYFMIVISIIFGIMGFISLIIQLSSKLFSKIKLKIFLQSLSIIGYFGFFTIINGKKAWINIIESLKNINENVYEFYLLLWPIMTTIFLLIINIRILLKQKIS